MLRLSHQFLLIVGLILSVTNFGAAENAQAQLNPITGSKKADRNYSGQVEVSSQVHVGFPLPGRARVSFWPRVIQPGQTIQFAAAQNGYTIVEVVTLSSSGQFAQFHTQVFWSYGRQNKSTSTRVVSVRN